MGLDICTSKGGPSTKYGSYSGVHTFRAAMIRACIAKLKTLEPLLNDHDEDPAEAEKRLKDDIDALESWIEAPTNTPVNYGMIEDQYPDHLSNAGRQDPRYFQALVGLWKLVYHSDCEGYHTPGDCLDIMATFTFCEPTFGKTEGSPNSDPTFWAGWFQSIKEVFEYAAKNEAFVDYH